MSLLLSVKIVKKYVLAKRAYRVAIAENERAKKQSPSDYKLLMKTARKVLDTHYEVSRLRYQLNDEERKIALLEAELLDTEQHIAKLREIERHAAELYVVEQCNSELLDAELRTVEQLKARLHEAKLHDAEQSAILLRNTELLDAARRHDESQSVSRS
jgi:predicted RNase H-like nuclease (RuvC/YqgF family)